jgi:hypothetical protein
MVWHVDCHPYMGRSRMKGVALYRIGRTGKWCLVEIPDGWRPSDPLPRDPAAETSFDTKEEALIALVGRLGQIPTIN